MIVKLFWLYHYFRFTRKWRDYPIADIYQNKQYFDELYKLLMSIPDNVHESLFIPNKFILTCYSTVEQYSKQLGQVTLNTKYRNLVNQPNLNIVRRNLRDYLVSDDGRPAKYASTMMVLGNQLKKLYEEINAISEDSRDYYYRQLKELFICGISICLSHIKEYA